MSTLRSTLDISQNAGIPTEIPPVIHLGICSGIPLKNSPGIFQIIILGFFHFFSSISPGISMMPPRIPPEIVPKMEFLLQLLLGLLH